MISTLRSSSSHCSASRVEGGGTRGALGSAPVGAGGRRSKTRVAESRNSSPAMIVTGFTPNARTISGASSALPISSPADETSPSIEVAPASSSVFATSGTVEASLGCETWNSTRTRNSTSSSAPNSVPSASGMASVSEPIPT